MNEQVTDKVGFDIVVGNPPYGSSLEDELKKYLRLKLSQLQFKIDAYSAFLINSEKLLKEKANLMFIIPSNFMDNKFEENSRLFFLKENQIILIHELDDKIFETAVVHSMIFSFNKIKTSNNYDIPVSTSKKLNDLKKIIPSDFFENQQFCSLALRTYENRWLNRLTNHVIM
jgi:tRNA1(Val) A37 N6-methylase TrmN6